MNKTAYNLRKYQTENQIKNKDLAKKLGVTPYMLFLMKKESYSFSLSEKEKIASLMGTTVYSLENEIHELINLRKQKIYGTNYAFIKYDVTAYSIKKSNIISAVLDFCFFFVFLLYASGKGFLSDEGGFQGILKTIVLVALIVCPLMFVAMPVLKIYFNHTYCAVVTTKIKPDDEDEIKGIVLSLLKRSIRKSALPYILLGLFESAICLYVLQDAARNVSFLAIVLLLLGAGSVFLAFWHCKYYTKRFGSKVLIKKGEETI